MAGEKNKRLSEITAQLQMLGFGQKVIIGDVPFHALRNWADCATPETIITWGARHHYSSRHPEVMEFEHLIVAAILDPDEVQVDLANQRTNSLFKEIDDRYDIVVSLWISDDSALKNSVKSARKQRRGKRRTGRNRGWGVWRR